jgi:tRNA(Arg) A34 adenosine deaminase TadA
VGDGHEQDRPQAEESQGVSVPHEEYMRRAIELSRQRMRAGEGGPFGAVIVLDGEIIGEGWNEVTSTNDPTAHAEIVAIRSACERIGDFSLEGAVIYSTCEPCPMCLAAIYWARLDKLFFSNTAEDAADIGFDDAYFYEELALDMAERELETERLLAEEAIEVFREWDLMEDKIEY